jgi:GNAT superfamily N-acetyltransferase
MQTRAVQACLRAGIESRATQVGPFLVLINHNSDNVFRNYAVPVDGAQPTADDVRALVEHFTARERFPRLEYVRPAPAVDDALRTAGFRIDATLTLMAVDDPVPAPANPDYRVTLVTDDDSLRQATLVQNTAYGEASDTEPDPAALRDLVADGGVVALAVHTTTGAPAGAGVCTPPRSGRTEIAGVGVLPAHRRHGVGALVTAALTEAAFGLGYRPFLQVERDEPARVYQRIGYRVIGEMADARLPRSTDRPVRVTARGSRRSETP